LNYFSVKFLKDKKMNICIFLIWTLFNSIIGGVEYFLYNQQVIQQKESFLWVRKIILPFFKLMVAFIVAYFYTNYEFSNEIFINGFGVYFMGISFHKGVFFQLRRMGLAEEDFHFFSHSINSLIPIKNTTIIDLYAFGRLVLFLLGYSILYIPYS